MTAQIKNESIQQPISKIFSDPDAQEALASKQNHSIRNQELQGRRKIIFDKVMDEDFQWNWFWRWPKWVNWLNTTLTCLLPIYGIWQSRTVPLDIRTFRLTCLYAIMTGLSITGGYHRLWAHRSYRATEPLRYFLAAFGGGAVQGSIRWWARDHRAHHRYTDTDKDPYSVRKGLLYSHFGWMVIKQNPKRIGRVDISDLNEDPLVKWQHKRYLWVMTVMALIVPMMIAGLGWGDWWGGFIYAGIIRVFLIQQSTFCVNSLAHYVGDQPFDDRRSARNHFTTALVTLGEGYHNFHHEFPNDYRNGIEWFQWDPTKWTIYLCKKLGLAYDLNVIGDNEIEMGRFQQKERKIDLDHQGIDWGIPLDTLPVWEWDEYVQNCRKGGMYICIAGVVHDVANFIDKHPGGRAMLGSQIGKDSTAAFNGGVYDHTNAAHNFVASMRVAKIRGGCEVEAWKKAQKDGFGLVRHGDKTRVIQAGQQVTRVTHLAKIDGDANGTYVVGDVPLISGNTNGMATDSK